MFENKSIMDIIEGLSVRDSETLYYELIETGAVEKISGGNSCRGQSGYGDGHYCKYGLMPVFSCGSFYYSYSCYNTSCYVPCT